MNRSNLNSINTSSPARKTLHSEYESRLVQSPMRLGTPGRDSRTSTPKRKQGYFSSPQNTPKGSVVKTPRTPKTPKTPKNTTNESTPLRESTIYGDRFIPSRSASGLQINFSLLDDSPSHGRESTSNSISINNNTNTSNANGAADGTNNTGTSNEASESNRDGHSTYSMLLRSELLGLDINPSPKRDKIDDKGKQPSLISNLFKYKRVLNADDHNKKMFSMSPVGTATGRLLSSPQKLKRKIAKVPFKVLDAPALQDDFYLNLVDWSSLNVLAVGLGSCVYLWSACTSKVTKLCDLGSETVTSVAWTQRASHLAVGSSVGEVQIWDTVKCKNIRTMGGHTARVGTMAWNAHCLASGSRDRTIYLRDVRARENFTSKLVGHKQEVCGLKWSFDDQQLASGGNDNKLYIWNAASSTPIMKFHDHTAAVKAIAWSPHTHGLLASGGGTADRCIRFWNTMTGNPLNFIDTGSQVCNLMWSKNINEVVSTHGYSLNQIIVWKYPSMTKVTTLTGHTYRVLYLAMSPDGQTIVTGAGDETLRFWSVFPGPKNKDGMRLGSSTLFPSSADIR